MKPRSPLSVAAVTQLLALCLAPASHAQGAFEPYMVKDLVTKNAGSSASDRTVVGDVLFFTHDSADLGRELWRTDGTEEGTTLVKDIWPGPESGLDSLRTLTGVGGTLFFVANDGQHGEELWTSDGTPEGTAIARDFSPGALSSHIREIADLDGVAVFTRARQIGTTGYVQEELYRSDGTPLNTVIVKDINPNYNTNVHPPVPLSSYPHRLLRGGDYVYFRADDGTHGDRLWRTDGTEAGTVLVEDPEVSPGFEVVDYGVNFNGGFFFGANDLAHGFGLWRTNGTPEGTWLVRQIDEEPYWSTTRLVFQALGDRLLLLAPHELWSSDGTPSGTVLIRDDLRLSREGVVLGDRFVFSASGPGQNYGTWATDGTEAGTYLVREFEDRYAGPTGYSVLGDLALFESQEDELWLTDGVQAWILFEPFYGPPVHELGFQVLGDKAFFKMDDGVHGEELWATTAMPGSQYMVRDLISDRNEGADIEDAYAMGETLYFVAQTHLGPDGRQRQLWRTDGTSEGTSLVWPGPTQEPKVLGDLLFFGSYENYKSQLYVTRGTPESTTLICEDATIKLSTLTRINGVVFFSTEAANVVDPQTGKRGYRARLYRTDGTAEGTQLLYEVYGSNYAGDSFFALGGEVFFRASDEEHGVELWKTDGTPEGTVLFADVEPGPASSYARPHYVYGNQLYFGADTGESGYESWTTDGTPEGTHIFRDPPLWPLTSTNGTLILEGEYDYPSGSGPALWVSDGTAEGTLRLESPWAERLALVDKQWVEFRGEMFFSGSDITSWLYLSLPCGEAGRYGHELWKTDGTYEGTVLVADIAPCVTWPSDHPASGTSNPRYFVIADDLLFFAADNDEGTHLWMTDGAPGNVSEVEGDDVIPWVRAYANGTVFFEHDDGVHGDELWAFRTKVFVGHCNTGVTEHRYFDKYITTWIQECAESAENDGKFVSCVAHLTNNLKKSGIISGSEKGAIQRCAAKAD
jgi:ELWxxDGT repeat protein